MYNLHFKPTNIYLLGILVFIFGCSAPTRPTIKTINEERWSVKMSADSFERNEITFLESYMFTKEGIQEGHFFYNLDGTLNNKEVTLFSKENHEPIGSQFFNAADSLLSIYSFKYEDGNKVLTEAYDATNRELLRFISYDYNSKGLLTTKRILNSSKDVMRIFKFKYDASDNENEFSVQDPQGNVILTEKFKITKVDESNNWIEKWGFVDDKPFSFRVRKITYWEE